MLSLVFFGIIQAQAAAHKQGGCAFIRLINTYKILHVFDASRKQPKNPLFMRLSGVLKNCSGGQKSDSLGTKVR